MSPRRQAGPPSRATTKLFDDLNPEPQGQIFSLRSPELRPQFLLVPLPQDVDVETRATGKRHNVLAIAIGVAAHLPIDGPVYPPGVPERIRALVDAGDPEAALEVCFREVVRMPDREFEVYRTLPTWKVRITLAPTIPRELTIERSYRFQPERFAQFSTPTLLLLGGDSPPVFRQTIDMVNAALLTSRIVVMPGQQHVAMDTAPELFLSEVIGFLSGQAAAAGAAAARLNRRPS